MTQNDPLQFFFLLPYLTIFIVSVLLGIISLTTTIVRTKLPILKNSSLFLGDIVLLPFAIMLISSFYKNAHSALDAITSWQWSFLTFLFSLFLTLFVVKRFRLWHITWIISDVLFFFYSYVFVTFFTKAIIQLLLGDNDSHFLWFLWLGVIVLLGLHQTIGVKMGSKTYR